MSVYANTLNAYAAKLKAQRKAAERDAQLAARRKSADQRLADKIRIEQARAEKEALKEKPTSATDVTNLLLDVVTRQYKMRTGYGFATGERAKVSKDLQKISELFFYEGSGKYHLKVDASRYSKAAYEIIVNTMINMRLIPVDIGNDGIRLNLRQIVVIRNGNTADVALVPLKTSIDEIKAYVAENEHLRHEYTV